MMASLHSSRPLRHSAIIPGRSRPVGDRLCTEVTFLSFYCQRYWPDDSWLLSRYGTALGERNVVWSETRE